MQFQEPRQGPPNKRRPRSLRSLFNLRITWYSLLILCCAILLMGWILARGYDEGIQNLRKAVDQADDLVFEKEREILRLQEQVRLAATDQFIANEARTKYGYLFPGEIRFVVVNPEVLGLPSRPPEATQPPPNP
ncbi:MAG: hypothetical protein GXZ04_05345 [Clostridiales bacterium]|nr:hypothetical protein [Clostridiales bacterium]